MFGAVSGRAALLCGVRFAPRFDPDNSKQGVEESGLHQGLTQTTANKELRIEPKLEIYAPQNFFNHKVFSSTLAVYAL